MNRSRKMAQRVLNDFGGLEEGRETIPQVVRDPDGAGVPGAEWPTACYGAVTGVGVVGPHRGDCRRPAASAPLEHRFPEWPKSPCVLNMVENWQSPQPDLQGTRLGQGSNKVPSVDQGGSYS